MPSTATPSGSRNDSASGSPIFSFTRPDLLYPFAGDAQDPSGLARSGLAFSRGQRLAPPQKLACPDPKSSPILMETGIGELDERFRPVPVTLATTLPSDCFTNVPFKANPEGAL